MFALQVLAAGDEDQGLLDALVVGPVAGGPQGVDQEAGVGQVGPLLLSIASAAVVVATLLVPFLLVPLESLEEAVGATVRPVRTYEPDPARSRYYTEQFERYRRLYPLTRTLKEPLKE